MGLSRLFVCSASDSSSGFKFKNLSHAGYSAASSEYGNEERVINDIRGIIDYYNTNINPPVKPGESKAAHYIKRLRPWTTQKFLCGQTGKIRAQRFTELLDGKGSSPKILRDVCERAYAEYKAAYNSWTASRILWCIGYHLGLKRHIITKPFITTAEEGGGAGEYSEVESLKSYLEGAYSTLMSRTLCYEDEKIDEQDVEQTEYKR